MKMKAAILRTTSAQRPFSVSKPLSIEEVELDPPKRGEVLIKVKAVGLCHSDLVAITGERAKPMPIVIGHEAAGIVEEIGQDVQGFAVGDHVVPSYVASCGRCEMCSVGRPALCEPATIANANAVLKDGTTRLRQGSTRIHHHSGVAGFAEYSVIPEEALVKIDKSVPFEHAALFGCGVVTGVGSVINTAQAKPGQFIAVVGLGGVGLSAVLAALAIGSGKVLALDLSEEKLAFARELGVHHALNAGDADVQAQIAALTGGGVHIAIETAGSNRALQMAYDITRRGGTTVTAGMPGPEAEITLSHLKIAAEERSIKGSYMGSCVAKRDIPRYLNMFQNGSLPVDKLMSRLIGFDDLNAAMDRLADAKTVREVLIP
ncbi:NDMA-dependent alcohol dehydrogenase [Rhodobacteraceae bacterium SB2]|jgi:alcohol dehydrogenase|nr:alcohol dehydrogenase catalytic domain-containing protein [Paracoccaceae bacterium]OAH07928.1 NDMA-dependent alcohol dehydrogenase [Rhodobacteraceae bacterium SB2]WQC63933.1 zinc-dependent alcohol dehydrogenase family protein [Alphaproteobacteria bacterium US3C007]MBT4230547.1 alcohol dehydrogenase catalytic domain-containing protein [Paracoccaceae bacterium]MBT4952860.1 alcohol dehydrogenase catalytic domain-containing protein [Paracoccaceae bacterium]